MIKIKGEAGYPFKREGHIVKSKLDKESVTLNFYHVTDHGELKVMHLEMTFDDAKKVAEAIWERLEEWTNYGLPSPDEHGNFIEIVEEAVDGEGNSIGPVDGDFSF